METKKIILNSLCVIGLILWAICFYIGFAYYRPDAIMTTVIAAVFVFLLMGGLVIAMKRFGDPQSVLGKVNYNVARNTERLAWVIYAIVSLASAVFILHFVNIDLNHKDTIVRNANDQIQEIDRIFAPIGDKAPGSYDEWVEQRVKAHIDTIENEGTKKFQATAMREKLIPENCKELFTKADDLRGYSAGAISNTWTWWFGGANQMQELQELKPKYEEELKKYSLAANGAEYDMKAIHNERLTDELTKLSGGDFTFMGILLVLILQALILLSYIAFRPKHHHDPVKATLTENITTFDPTRARQNQGGPATIDYSQTSFGTPQPHLPEERVQDYGDGPDINDDMPPFAQMPPKD